jgi:hypothetical protein
MQGADKPHLLANLDHLEARQVHKSVHRRALRMVRLQQDKNGKYPARKRLPDDVRDPMSDLRKWDAVRNQVHDALREAVGDAEWERSDPDELWREDAKLRRAVYPVLADVGETAQFLATKRLTLNVEGRESFLYWLYDDLAAVLARLGRLAEGDYGDDEYAKRFPKFEGLDSGETPAQIFEKWVAEKRPAPSTEESWRYPFRAMAAYFPNRSVASITPEEAKDWIASLVSPKRSARTVDSNYLSSANTIFRWAVEHRRIPRNPFEKVKLTVPKATRLREKAFRSDEWRTILKASLAITETDTPGSIRTCSGTLAAMRWRTGATIRALSRLTSATATSSTLCDTPSYRQRGLRISGETTDNGHRGGRLCEHGLEVVLA